MSDNLDEQAMQETNVLVKNAQRLAQAAQSRGSTGRDLTSLTAVQAGKVLGVSPERIELVLDSNDGGNINHFMRGRPRKPRYDIDAIYAVKTNVGCDRFDPVFLEIAAARLRLLEMATEPTSEMIRATQTGYAENIFREPSHYILQVRKYETAEDIMRKSAVRMVAWADDESLKQGFRWRAVLAYGSLETARPAVKALQLFVYVKPCPDGKDVDAYRHELMDGLLLGKKEPKAVLQNTKLFADWIVEEDTCPAFAKALADHYDDFDEIKAWTEPLITKWKGRESELTSLIRRDMRWICPIVESLSIRELIAFYACFGQLSEVEGILKAGPKPEIINIPQSCPCTEDVWKQFVTSKSDLVMIDGRWAKVIPLDLVGRMLGLRMRLNSRHSYGWAYRQDGSLIKGQQLQNLYKLADKLAVDILSGEVIDIKGNSVDTKSYFSEVAVGQADPMPGSIKRKFDRRRERRKERLERRAKS